jgi:hypothetical protein
LKLRFAPSIFEVAFCCAYICAFAWDWPLFRYYPLHGNISWGKQALTGAGPAMAWYGLLANAGIVATLLAISVPDHATERILRDYLWLIPCGAMLACVFFLRKFFA